MAYLARRWCVGLCARKAFSVIYNKRKRAYSSYQGEISAHPGDKVARRFHADAPNKLWPADITQFTLAGYKCYLSAVVDCFDGKPVRPQAVEKPGRGDWPTARSSTRSTRWVTGRRRSSTVIADAITGGPAGSGYARKTGSPGRCRGRPVRRTTRPARDSSGA